MSNQKEGTIEAAKKNGSEGAQLKKEEAEEIGKTVGAQEILEGDNGSLEKEDIFSKADQFFEQRDLVKAEEELLEIIKKDPKNPKAYNKLGIIYLETGDFDDAEQAFIKALEFDPGNDYVYNNLGLALYNRGKYKEAIEAYNRSINLGEPIAHRYINLGLAFSALRDLKKAEEAYRKALAIDPENSDYQKLLLEIRSRI